MKIGIIGGSGMYAIDTLEAISDVAVQTPFGDPSDVFVHGRIGAHEVYFLPRHGRGHRLMPSEINHRANIFALKTLGVERVLSFSAVGSLRADIRPRDIVLPDQYFDRTKQSAGHTFFGEGVVAHVGFGEPACPALRRAVADCVAALPSPEGPDGPVGLVTGGTYVNMEGPAFSTRAESHAYRQMGFDIIGMTSLPEAKLCREAELCYQALAMVTDYDCWHDTEEAVSMAMVSAHLRANTARARQVLGALIPALPDVRTCACGDALATALLTDRSAVPAAARERLAPLIGRYL